jgi:Rieske Fe-S protein
VIPRRAVLRGACAGAALAACGRRAASDSGSGGDSGAVPDSATLACADTGQDVTGWVEIALADHPGLEHVGGYAYVEIPEALLDVVVAQPEAGCFVALWRICTHGACETEWDPDARVAVCPCHWSVFAQDGSVLEGPAEAPLRTFAVVRRGASLWLRR